MLTRKPDEANLRTGAGVVYGDLAKPETLAPALDGVTGIALMLPYGLDPVRAHDEIGGAQTSTVQRPHGRYSRCQASSFTPRSH